MLTTAEIERMKAGYGSAFYRRLIAARSELEEAIAEYDAAVKNDDDDDDQAAA